MTVGEQIRACRKAKRLSNEYVVSQDRKNKEIYYCHKRGFEYIPVFGSIGDKEKAKAICKLMNHDGKVRYS